MAKSKTPPYQTIFFYPLTSTEHWSQPSLTTHDKELISILEVRIDPWDLNPRPLTPQSVTLPTLPQAGVLYHGLGHINYSTALPLFKALLISNHDRGI